MSGQDGRSRHPAPWTTWRSTAQYLILAAEDEQAFAARGDEELAQAYWTSWQGYLAALAQSGLLRSRWAGATLDGDHGATARRLVQDGPYADTKEQLGATS